MYKKSLFIFRRDLRLDDNNGINAALLNSETVVPCFIFDSRQVSRKNTYFSQNAFQFMLQSLEDLAQQFHKYNARLYCFYGIADRVVKRVIHQEKIDAVYVCSDYTPFSIKRDECIKNICLQQGKAYHAIHDLLLHEPGAVTTKNGEPFSIFTPFYKRSLQLAVKKPVKIAGKSFYTKPIPTSRNFVLTDFTKNFNKNCAVVGGSKQGRSILDHIKKFKNYAQEHDIVALSTTHLSAHNKFGTVSIREVYNAIINKLRNNHPLVRQLYWRDFFTIVAYYSPFVFGQPYKQKYKKLPWSNNRKYFNAWCNGATGFPIVDAGMRELNTTGFMHNRARLITASFLVKDLHINWLWGERYFAQQLVDYDPAVNNGNWQWVASTGCDAQPYFRIFNPWIQQKKFDPECMYIKKWIPELKNLSPKTIHSWYKQKKPLHGYPLPIVDHKHETQRAKMIYKKVNFPL